MLKLKFYIKGNASQMDQRFCSSVSSDKKDQFLCHVLILFGKLPSSSFSSSSQFKAMFFGFFNVMFNVFYNGSFPANESDIVYIESLYNRGEPILTHDL